MLTDTKKKTCGVFKEKNVTNYQYQGNKIENLII